MPLVPELPDVVVDFFFFDVVVLDVLPVAALGSDEPLTLVPVPDDPLMSEEPAAPELPVVVFPAVPLVPDVPVVPIVEPVPFIEPAVSFGLVPFIEPPVALTPVSSYVPVPCVPPIPVPRVWMSPDLAAAPPVVVVLISGEVIGVDAGVVSRRVS